jgi:PEP-CTERM motif-containing protein
MKKLAFIAFCAALLAAPLSSAAVLDFSTGTAGVGGTIVDLGGGNAQGMNILIDTLVVTGTAFDGVYNVDGGLACATGLGASCGALSFDTVANTFSIVGSVPGLGVATTTLLTGSLGTFNLFKIAGLASFGATGTDSKAAELLSAVGIDPSTPFTFAGFSQGFNPVPCGPGKTCYSAISSDILNTSGVVGESVPEPTTLMLIGGGLLGLVRARRRVA